MFEVAILRVLCRRCFRKEIYGKCTRQISVFAFFPRPFLLDKFWLLFEDSPFFKELAVTELVPDGNVKPLILDPLHKLPVSELFSLVIEQCWIRMSKPRWLR